MQLDLLTFEPKHILGDRDGETYDAMREARDSAIYASPSSAAIKWIVGHWVTGLLNIDC